MAQRSEIVDAIVARLGPLDVRARAMFGGYCVYCDDKVVALVCDDLLFLKPTSAVDAAGIDLEMAPPYEGAKDHYVVGERLMADERAFRALVQATADALPKPRPKKTSKKARRKR